MKKYNTAQLLLLNKALEKVKEWQKTKNLKTASEVCELLSEYEELSNKV